MGQYVVDRLAQPLRWSTRLTAVLALGGVIAWIASPVPGVLFFLAILLISHKVIHDLGAFTEESSRKADVFSILIIAILALWLALAIPGGDSTPIEVPCIESICAIRSLA